MDQYDEDGENKICNSNKHVCTIKMIYMHESMSVPAFNTQTSTRDKNPILSTSFGSVTFTRSKYSIFVSFFFSQYLVPFFFYTTFAFNSYIPTTFSFRECFSLLHAKIKNKNWTGHLTSHPRLNPPPHTARRWSTYGWQWMMTGAGRWV